MRVLSLTLVLVISFSCINVAIAANCTKENILGTYKVHGGGTWTLNKDGSIECTNFHCNYIKYDKRYGTPIAYELYSEISDIAIYWTVSDPYRYSCSRIANILQIGGWQLTKIN